MIQSFNARWYDPQLRRFISPDPVTMGSTGTERYNPYWAVRFNPLRFVDPDGRLAVWVGGAGDKTNTDAYSYPMVDKMNSAGINAQYVYTPRYDGALAQVLRAIRSGLNICDQQAVNVIKSSYNRSDGQFNLVGYSMGSVDSAFAALQLSKEGKTIDHLVLIGSPISDSSSLMQQLLGQSNIKNIFRYDVSGDPLAPTIGFGDLNRHFYFTDNDDGQQDWLSNNLFDQGIR